MNGHGYRSRFTPGYRMWIGAATALLMGACDAGTATSSTGGRISEHDSAGVTIIEVPAHVLEQLPTWTLSERPLLSIGDQEGADEYLFSRIVDAVRLTDGRIAVADRQTQDVRVFRPEGTLDWRRGRRGDGPGEFRAIQMIGALGGGRVAVWDQASNRTTVFDSAGNLERDWVDRQCAAGSPRSLAPTQRSCRVPPIGYFADGTVLIPTGEAMVPSFGPGTQRAGIDQVFAGRRIGIGVLTPESYLVLDSPQQASLLAVRDPAGKIYPFTMLYEGEPEWTVSGEWAAYGNSAAPLIHLRGSGGVPHRIVRLNVPEVPVTKQMVEDLRGSDLSWYTGGDTWPSAVQEWLSRMPTGPHVPFFSEILLDPRGALWLRDYYETDLTPREAPHWWTVFDPRGRPLARVRAAGIVHDVAPDAILVGTRDEMGVERVQVYSIVK